MPDNPTPEILKKMKIDAPPMSSTIPSPHSPPSKGKGKSPAVTVEDVEDEENVDSSGQFAPGGDADYFVEEDEEGRFFGGGLTKEQKEILNIFDTAGEDN